MRWGIGVRHNSLCIFVADVGNRGDLVSVDKSLGRNWLLAKNLAIYASPENRLIFEEENRVSPPKGVWMVLCM